MSFKDKYTTQEKKSKEANKDKIVISDEDMLKYEMIAELIKEIRKVRLQ